MTVYTDIPGYGKISQQQYDRGIGIYGLEEYLRQLTGGASVSGYGIYDYGQTSTPAFAVGTPAPPGGGEQEVDVDSLPEPLRTAVVAFMGPLQAVRVLWEALPDWLQKGLIILGIIAVVIVLIRTGILGAAAGAAAGMAGRAVAGGVVASALHGSPVKTWLNGSMAKFANGTLGARKKDGSWTYWRPKRPIVLMPGKRMSLGQLLRADAYLDRETRRLAKLLRRRLGQGRRGGRGRGPSTMVIESGPGSVKMLPGGG